MQYRRKVESDGCLRIPDRIDQKGITGELVKQCRRSNRPGNSQAKGPPSRYNSGKRLVFTNPPKDVARASEISKAFGKSLRFTDRGGANATMVRRAGS